MEAGAILLDVILTWPSLHSERLLTQVLALFPHNTAGTDYVSEKLINSVSKFLTRFCRVTLSEHLDTCNLPICVFCMSSWSWNPGLLWKFFVNCVHLIAFVCCTIVASSIKKRKKIAFLVRNKMNSTMRRHSFHRTTFIEIKEIHGFSI
jgi:hypothetical protein